MNYLQIYAKRHKISLDKVKESEVLTYAAFLEWQLARHILSVRDARRLFVREYPKSNRLNVSRFVIDEFGIKREDKLYKYGSVLELIKPYEDSIRRV